MTLENRLKRIIETIHAFRTGAPVSKGGVTLLLNHGLTYTRKPWTGRERVGSICFKRQPPGWSATWGDQYRCYTVPHLGASWQTGCRTLGLRVRGLLKLLDPALEIRD